MRPNSRLCSDNYLCSKLSLPSNCLIVRVSLFITYSSPLFFKHLHLEEGGTQQFSPPLIKHVGMLALASVIPRFLTVDTRSNKLSGSLSPLLTLLMCVFGFVITECGLICEKKKDCWSPLMRPSGDSADGVDGG